MSEVIRRQQMNPVVGVAGAMMERRRRQSSSFSQVIQGESNEAEWRKKPEQLLRWRRAPGCVENTSIPRAAERKMRERERGRNLMPNMKNRGRHKAQ